MENYMEKLNEAPNFIITKYNNQKISDDFIRSVIIFIFSFLCAIFRLSIVATFCFSIFSNLLKSITLYLQVDIIRTLKSSYRVRSVALTIFTCNHTDIFKKTLLVL